MQNMNRLSNNDIITIFKNEFDNLGNNIIDLSKLTSYKKVQYIKNRVNEEYLKSNTLNLLIEPENTQFINSQVALNYLKYMKPYYKYIIEKIKYLDSIPIVEQRSEEWFNQRNNLLSVEL